MLNAFHKLLILLSIVLVCHVSGMAQCPETNPNCNQVRNWVFGDSVWLYFADTGVIINLLPISTREASSTISMRDNDSMEYYAKPERIYDNLGNEFCSGLKGHNSSLSGSLFLRHPQNDTTIYYLTGDEASTEGQNAYLHILEPWAVTKNKLLLNNVTEQLASVNHSNNRDVWVSFHNNQSDTFFNFLLTKVGVICPVNNSVGSDYSNFWAEGGGMKFSPNGDYLAASLLFSDKFDLMKFDCETGQFYAHINVPLQSPFHVCFSHSSERLYINSTEIFQYTLTNYSKIEIQASKFAITKKHTQSLGDISLTPYDEIYVAYNDSGHVGVISTPNNKGINANFMEYGVQLDKNSKCRMGLPNFNASYFYTPAIDFAYTEDCWNHEYQFEGRDTLKATAFKWIFEKATVRDSILTKHCTYQFPDTGKWLVSHIASNGTRTDTVTKTLTIRQRWKSDMLGSDTFYCENDSIKLVLRAPENMHCVHWMGEEPNLDTAEGPILDYDHFHLDSMEVDTAGTYYIKVTNKAFCQTWDTITIVEGKMPNKPVVSDDSKELASTIESARYRWFLNDTFYFETSNRSFIPTENGYYQVQLLTEHGCESPRSDSFHYDKIGIVPVVNNLPFKVYPNPSDGKITIEVEKSNTYLIEVYDLTGKQVVKQHLSAGNKTQTITIDVKGTYLLKVSDNEGHHAQRLIKIL